MTHLSKKNGFSLYSNLELFQIGCSQRLRKTIPYWNDELSTLWKNMHDKEKLFLKTNNKNRRQFYRADFLSAQKTFDKRLRYFERKCRTELSINIE